MKTLRVLDSTGDTCLQFDGTEATAAQEAEAKKVFDDWMKKKRTAFLTQRPGGKEDAKIKSFDEIEDGAEVVLVPAIQAG